MPAPAMRDIVEEHLDEARFLRLRRQRVFAVLQGNAAHQRGLERRLGAHLDALACDPAAAMGLWEEALAGDDEHAWYATAASWALSEARDGLWARWAAEAPAEALRGAGRDVLWFHGRQSALGLVEGWLRGQEVALQRLALAVVVRWGDANIEALGRWAVTHADEGMRAEGLHALAVAGVAVAAASGPVVMASVAADGLRSGVIEDTARMDPAAALAMARALEPAALATVDAAAVLRGIGGRREDVEALAVASAQRVTPAVCVGLALAGAAGELDGLWARADDRGVSNALREAAYVALGEEVPPGGLGVKTAEDEDEAAVRRQENAVLATRLREAGSTPGRWGGRAAGELSARHRRWAGLVDVGAAAGDWEGRVGG
ncbi:MAG: hypothetical protein IPF99_34875 [Deltaproteobacteria bacterium]|nr:hypothetical protein [Deltaproteobacteria bacterium]